MLHFNRFFCNVHQSSCTLLGLRDFVQFCYYFESSKFAVLDYRTAQCDYKIIFHCKIKYQVFKKNVRTLIIMLNNNNSLQNNCTFAILIFMPFLISNIKPSSFYFGRKVQGGLYFGLYKMSYILWTNIHSPVGLWWWPWQTASPAVVGCHSGCVLPPVVVHVTSHTL